jgi:hypothetical protein
MKRGYAAPSDPQRPAQPPPKGPYDALVGAVIEGAATGRAAVPPRWWVEAVAYEPPKAGGPPQWFAYLIRLSAGAEQEPPGKQTRRSCSFLLSVPTYRVKGHLSPGAAQAVVQGTGP